MPSVELPSPTGSPVRSSFQVILISGVRVILLDLDAGGASVTNDAQNVIDLLQHLIPGGIEGRHVHYRDSEGRFDEILIDPQGNFARFCPGLEEHQELFRRFATEALPEWTVYGDSSGGRNIRVIRHLMDGMGY